MTDPAHAQWLDCEGTWFIGVDALDNGPGGEIGGVPFAGPAVDALGALPPLHRAQLSVVFPGYPRPRAGESAAGFAYRRDRAAAHVDGITLEGPEKRRMVTEPHGFILGIGLTVGSGVAVAGIIGFVGLIVPHLVRPLTDRKPSSLLLPSALAGALLVLVADSVVRILPLVTELRLGIALSLIGAPFFLWLLLRMRRGLA